MAARNSVLIVSEADDLHATAMAATLRLHHGIEPILFDLRDFPRESGSFRLHRSGTARALSHVTGLDTVRSVWWRRPHPCRVPDHPRPEAPQQSESDGFLEGMLWSIPAAWVNDPGADRTAARKIVQLETAQRAGFLVPETLVTNDPDEARSFAESRPGAVVRKRTGSAREGTASARILRRAEFAALADIRAAPTILQDYVDADHDLAVVWVDGTEWTVRVTDRAATRGVVGFEHRHGNASACAPEQLPASVSKSMTTLMGALGLSFGVATLRLGRDGEYYFLAVDPQGRFAHLELATGLPLFRSLGNLLAHGDGSVVDR
ncbi:hypothetical protein ACTD5D_14290 [Nocardia takedensis]|uniref:hypothetical protein n=1 Tax=Nocardia takedensis TaxID=259390 RepID=UPI0002E57323|nr:hypothetical protein [Nocardia takedensis]